MDQQTGRPDLVWSYPNGWTVWCQGQESKKINAIQVEMKDGIKKERAQVNAPVIQVNTRKGAGLKMMEKTREVKTWEKEANNATIPK